MGKRFTSVQKAQVIDLHLHGGYATRQLAKEFAISRACIQNWLKAYRKNTGTKPLPNNVNRRKVSSGKATKMMMNEIKMQIEVLETFQSELERWDVPE